MSKVAKVICFTAQSSEKHVADKVKSVLKWLKSGHEVRVKIEGKADRHKAMENIYKTLERDVSSGARFLQKSVKPEFIKFVLMPTKEACDLEIKDNKIKVEVEEELASIMSNKDIFSEDFEKELLKSIKDEKIKNKKN